MNADNGVIKNIEVTKDDDGRQVLRVVVDFYNMKAPDLTINVVWKLAPVRIVAALDDEAQGAGLKRTETEVTK